MSLEIHRIALANKLHSTMCELCMGRSFVEIITHHEVIPSNDILRLCEFLEDQREMKVECAFEACLCSLSMDVQKEE